MLEYAWLWLQHALASRVLWAPRMHASRSRRFLTLCLLSVVGPLAIGCSSGKDSPAAESGGAGGIGGGPGGSGGVGAIAPAPPPPEAGHYVSADGTAEQIIPDYLGGGGVSGAGAAGMGAPAGSIAGGDPREVVEGDIYRVLDRGALLNLNSYRGLQVIDVSDPSAPAIIGRTALLGTPVEMYVRGTTAFVLLNNWQGYYGSRDDVAVEHKQGGLVATVDISDRTAPRELDRVFIEGAIQVSRVVQNDTVAALYVASSRAREPASLYDNGYTQTIVTSFDIGTGRLVKKSELDLGGSVTDIQATPTELLVASESWTGAESRHSVSVVDISDPNGAMVRGSTVPVAGAVRSQFNMDLYNGVLRVVSTSWATSQNFVETFAARDLRSITPLHVCSFGAAQQLYATLFLGNKAFFVTYLRQDPFHAFEIRDDGACIEHNEFIVSGWNDFFRPVAGGTRLIGIGVDDADATSTPAVSLYDITNLANPAPLVARARAGNVQWSWSEAQSDHRAFSVIEGAVQVSAPDGTAETGLVLLPYQGYGPQSDGSLYYSGVALFTFSDRTVTPRGSLAHDSAVRRSFTTDATTIANLSEVSLSLYDHSDPTMPEKLGSVALAPDYARLLRYGDQYARVTRAYYDPSAPIDAKVMDTVELVPAGADPGLAEPVASFQIPGGARLLKAGDLLVSIEQAPAHGGTFGTTEPYVTKVALFDLSDPSRPRAAGTAETRDLVPTYFGYGAYHGFPGGFGPLGFVGCGVGASWFDGTQADGVFALEDKVVFVDARGELARLGSRNTCEYYPRYDGCSGRDCPGRLEGYASCSALGGAPWSCIERLMRCDYSAGVPTHCVAVGHEDVMDELEMSCWADQVQRVWSRYAFKALDVSDPDAPVFGALVDMPRTEEGVSVLPDGDSLYYTYKVPVTLEGDGRPHVSYYFKHLAFDDVQAPSVAPKVSIPGELIAVNGGRVYTKDFVWSERAIETQVHELAVANARASIEASRAFVAREVREVVVADERLYVVHSPLYGGYLPDAAAGDFDHLALLGFHGLALEAEVEVDRYATLEAVHDRRALFTVSGGLLMMNVEDAARPYAQAFFHTNGWPEQILFEGDEIVISAGMYGIYTFDAEATNLLSP